MLKKTITYTDYDNVKRTEDHYFNLTMAELQEMELTTPGGFAALLRKIVDEKNVPEIYRLFKSVILKAYGIKSAAGRRFIKSDEISKEFTETGAYEVLINELTSNDKAGADFINAIMPADLAEKVTALGNSNVAPVA